MGFGLMTSQICCFRVYHKINGIGKSICQNLCFFFFFFSLLACRTRRSRVGEAKKKRHCSDTGVRRVGHQSSPRKIYLPSPTSNYKNCLSSIFPNLSKFLQPQVLCCGILTFQKHLPFKVLLFLWR